MNEYELTIVLPAGVSAARKKAVVQLIDKLMKTVKGKVKNTKDWGELDLAYEIKKNSSGVFIHFILELEARGIKAISDKLKLESSVLRFLVVKKEKESRGK